MSAPWPDQNDIVLDGRILTGWDCACSTFARNNDTAGPTGVDERRMLFYRDSWYPMSQASLNVLLVDDEESVLRLFTRVLRNAGYQVHPANSGVEAFSLLEQNLSWDAAILDRAMPDIRGEDLARRIRVGSPNLPIIMMSGNIDAIVNPALFDEILAKPFMPLALLECLSRTLVNCPRSRIT